MCPACDEGGAQCVPHAMREGLNVSRMREGGVQCFAFLIDELPCGRMPSFGRSHYPDRRYVLLRLDNHSRYNAKPLFPRTSSLDIGGVRWSMRVGGVHGKYTEWVLLYGLHISLLPLIPHR